MNSTFLFAILSLMPVSVDAQSEEVPSQVEQQLQSSEREQDTSQQFVIAASIWEEIEPQTGKVKRRVLCEPTLVVSEGIKAKFLSGGLIPSRVGDRSNDLQFGTQLNAVVVLNSKDSVRIACDVTVGIALQSDGDEVRTYSQSFGIARDLKLGEEKTVNFDMGKRKLRLTLEVDAVDPIALQK